MLVFRIDPHRFEDHLPVSVGDGTDDRPGISSDRPPISVPWAKESYRLPTGVRRSQSVSRALSGMFLRQLLPLSVLPIVLPAPLVAGATGSLRLGVRETVLTR